MLYFTFFFFLLFLSSLSLSLYCLYFSSLFPFFSFPFSFFNFLSSFLLSCLSLFFSFIFNSSNFFSPTFLLFLLFYSSPFLILCLFLTFLFNLFFSLFLLSFLPFPLIWLREQKKKNFYIFCLPLLLSRQRKKSSKCAINQINTHASPLLTLRLHVFWVGVKICIKHTLEFILLSSWCRGRERHKAHISILSLSQALHRSSQVSLPISAREGKVNIHTLLSSSLSSPAPPDARDNTVPLW